MPDFQSPKHLFLTESGVLLSALDPMQIVQNPLSSDGLLAPIEGPGISTFEHERGDQVKMAVVPFTSLFSPQWPEVQANITALPYLEHLAVVHHQPSTSDCSTRVLPDTAAVWLSSLPNLKGIAFDGVTDIRCLLRESSFLNRLLLFGARYARLGESEVQSLTELENLRSLDLEGCIIEGADWSFGRGLGSLLFLSLENVVGLPSDIVTGIKRLESLRCLNVTGALKPADVIELRRHLPGCEVVSDEGESLAADA